MFLYSSLAVRFGPRLSHARSIAYLRITVARAARKHPLLLPLLSDGRLHLTGIALLAPHLTPENRDTLVRRAIHRTRRQIEELVAEIAPRPDAPTLLRKLPGLPALPTAALAVASVAAWRPVVELRPDGAPPPNPVSSPPPASRRAPPAVVELLAPTRYKVQFTASAALHDKLERLQALMRAQVPSGDLAAIVEQAVTEKLERLEASRFAKTTSPRKGLSETDTSPSSRHIPAAVRRAVRERDGDRCRFVDQPGRRCSERHRLEYHHRRPFGLGGDHRPHNPSLMCRAHNGYLAEHDFGREALARHRHPQPRAYGAT